MTIDDRLVSGASSESSLPPNKSSGDIGDRTWTPEQFWEFATAFLGDHEANTSRDMIESRGLVLIPAAEIERLRRERDEARQLVTEANNSLFGSQAYFHSMNGGPFDRYHLSRGIEQIKDDARRHWQESQAAEPAVAAAWEEAAKIAEAKALEFLSPEYATGQPLSSFNERFACEQVASAIRAAGAEKTVESGHSPSTHNGAMSL